MFETIAILAIATICSLAALGALAFNQFESLFGCLFALFGGFAPWAFFLSWNGSLSPEIFWSPFGLYGSAPCFLAATCAFKIIAINFASISHTRMVPRAEDRFFASGVSQVQLIPAQLRRISTAEV